MGLELQLTREQLDFLQNKAGEKGYLFVKEQGPYLFLSTIWSDDRTKTVCSPFFPDFQTIRLWENKGLGYLLFFRGFPESIRRDIAEIYMMEQDRAKSQSALPQNYRFKGYGFIADEPRFYRIRCIDEVSFIEEEIQLALCDEDELWQIINA